MVRPRWPWRLGHLSPWRGLHIWTGHFRNFQPRQRPNFSFKSPPAGHGGTLSFLLTQVVFYTGCTFDTQLLKRVACKQYSDLGLQLVPRPQCGDDLQRTKLLLSVWKPGSNHGARWHFKIFLVSKSIYILVHFLWTFSILESKCAWTTACVCSLQPTVWPRAA